MLFSALFALSCWSLVLPSLSVAKPLPLAGRDVTKDAPYTVPVSTLSSAIECPSSTPIGDAPGGVVLLVHGTGSTGEESWGSTPYASLLPQLSPGFDICWITLPGRSQGDIQVSAEYVAYNVAPLASKSKTGTISVIGHSQGNLDIQWALNFWPSTRPLVKSFTSLAGDFNGTDEGPFLCSIGNLTSTGCTPATIQQSTTRLTGGGPSAFLAALHTFGGKALVKTTSLFTRYDDVIQSEQEPYPTSRLPGADSIAVSRFAKAIFEQLERADLRNFTPGSSKMKASVAQRTWPSTLPCSSTQLLLPWPTTP